MKRLAAMVLALVVLTPTSATAVDHDVVYYRTHTATPWGISAVMKDWSKASLVDTQRVASCKGLPRTRCIHIYPLRLPEGTAGTARNYDGRWTIGLDPYQVKGYRLRRGVLCHEVGHTLGLNHTDKGCLTALVSADAIKPSRWSLRNAYLPTYSSGAGASTHYTPTSP